jgi:hypothetical protein
VVVDDPELAARLARDGRSVVLVVDPRTDVVEPATGLPGRIATVAGPTEEEATWDAAREMDAELFAAS